ncbi:hypothetical protein UABHE_006168 [Candidatus Uabimicrobium helgolandensis]
MKYIVLIAFVVSFVVAQENVEQQMKEMLKRIEKLEQDNKELKTQVRHQEIKDDIEDEVDDLLGDIENVESTPTRQPGDPLFSFQIGQGTSLQLVDLSFIGLLSVGSSTADEDELLFLQGGAHDPRRRGFTLQQFEIHGEAAIDPYVRAFFTYVMLIDEEGETVLELEEAYFVTQMLPYGLQFKAGQFFTEFGKLTPHPHDWAFVDQPVIYSRFFGGDGLRNPGASLSWNAPLPWYSEVIVSAQNAFGETATSFLFEEGEQVVDGHDLVERDVESLKDLIYMLSWKNVFMPSEILTLELGYSFLIGPNGTGDDTTTIIHGLQFYAKWKPRDNKGRYVTWHTEFLLRNYEADADPNNANDNEVLNDWGFFTQVIVGLNRFWNVAGRYEYAVGDKGEADRTEFRDERHRLSASATYYPSEFFSIRLQYNLDKAQFLGDSFEHSVWLQFGFLVGTHGAHKY